MELRVLGPLELRVAGDAIPLGTPKQRTVLALLAVNAGRVVGLDELVDELWPESPPASAIENTRGYAANLRRLFTSADPGMERIARLSTGYVLAVGTDELDLLAFLDECHRGRTAWGREDLPSAASLLTSAQARWHGRMLTGVPCGPALFARCAAVEEERLALAEDLAEIELALGRPERAATGLREHVHLNPLRERGHALFIKATYRLGDVAGALAAFQTARTALVDELGIEPGPELNRLHAMVLNRDPELVHPGVPPALTSTIPRELPPDLGRFVGRTQEIAELCRILDGPDSRRIRPRPALTIVYGPGGVGKSALAVHVAHQLVDEFPDGQIYLDLHGSTPGLRPLSPIEALGRCLRSLGVPRDEIPTGESDALTRFRTLTSGRQLLIVLDNATGARQIASLIPGSGSCGVLVTAREPLGAVDADCRVRLTALSLDEGSALLGYLAKDIPMSRTTATSITALCDALPLAIRIAAGRLIGRPDMPPEDLEARLTDRLRRLDELELDGLGVRLCIRVGYESLTSDPREIAQLAAKAFRLLGLLSVPDVGADVVAAMLGPVEISQAEAALNRLVAIQLLVAVEPGRYRLHDLVRLVAAELAVEEDDAETRDRSLRRALSYYLVGLTRAEDLIRPGRLSHVRDPSLEVDEVSVPVASSGDAHTWIGTELLNALAAAELASTLPGAARRFTLWIVYWTSILLFNRLELETARRYSRLVFDSAKRYDDREMEGWGQLLLGRCEAELGDYTAALQRLTRARALLAGTSTIGMALVLNALGGVAHRQDAQDIALVRYHECLRFSQEHNLVSMESSARFNIGNVHAAVGRWTEARHHLEESLDIRRRLNDRFGIGACLSILAVVYARQGEFTSALSCIEDGLRHTKEVGDRRRECQCLLIAAEVHLREGRHDVSLALAEELVTIAHAYRHRYAEAAGLRQVAKALEASGDRSRAMELRADAERQFGRLTSYLDPVLEDYLSDESPPPSR